MSFKFSYYITYFDSYLKWERTTLLASKILLISISNLEWLYLNSNVRTTLLPKIDFVNGPHKRIGQMEAFCRSICRPLQWI